MKLSYNWLNDFADFNTIPFAKLHEKISLSICEVDSVTEYNQFLETIVVAKILETKKHPDADKLTICQADLGAIKLQIVTAASVQVGDIVPLAMIGTVLLDGKIIGEGKLRGIDSFGMFCSEKELGLAEESSGLMLLPNDSILGSSLRKVLEMEDKILLIDNKSITHRPDLWSHFGFARELAAQLNIPLKFNPFEAKFSYSEITSPTVIENKNAHSYFAVNIENVKIAASLRKFSSRLQRCGIKSINNIVDVSNYVMLEMGQPTHFFDREKLGTISLSVEFAKDKEALALLDKTVKELNSNILTIRNNSEAVAIAGIMGGEDSAISNSTKNIILESACFRRENIRKSIQITKIRTEAAMRYEKGLDSSSSMPLINRSLQLLKENGCGDFSASKPAGFESVKKIKMIETSFDFINQKLGTVFEEKIILDILHRLNFSVKEIESK